MPGALHIIYNTSKRLNEIEAMRFFAGAITGPSGPASAENQPKGRFSGRFGPLAPLAQNDTARIVILSVTERKRSDKRRISYVL